MLYVGMQTQRLGLENTGGRSSRRAFPVWRLGTRNSGLSNRN